jgi:hypothetical protein
MSRHSAVVSLALSASLAAQCIPTPGVAIPIAMDSLSGPHAIGFPFPIFGTTYTDIHISDHGICFLSNGAVPAPPAATPLVHSPAAATLVANGPVLCPFWSDTIPGTQGQLYIDAQATQCTITWANVQSFGVAVPLMTFQLELFATGELEFVYDPQVTNNSTWQSPGNNAVVGVAPGAPALLPAASDFRSSPTTTDDTIFEDFLSANTFDLAGDALRLVPANPGWTVTRVRDGSECAYVVAYGAGCEGLELASTPPIMGQPWLLTTTGLSYVSQIGFTLFAFNREDPPIPLSSYGVSAPGCLVHIPPLGYVARLVGVNQNGAFTVTVNMPATAPWLVGESWTNQTFAMTNQNAAGIASSNGVHCTMGY